MKKILLISMVLCAVMSVSAQTIVLSEDFSAIVDSNSYTITNKLDSFTNVPGWSGDWVYPSFGKVKIGKSSEGGYIQTPSLNLSNNGGHFIVSFDAKRWSSDQSKIIVTANGESQIVQGLTNNSFNTFNVEFSNGTDATAIKFESFQASKSRFFIDNIVVTSMPDNDAPYVSYVTPHANSLDIRFNEALDATSAQNVNNYSLSDNINISAATLNGNVVTLSLNPAMTEGNSYTLTVSNIADLSGNILTFDTTTFTFGVSAEFCVSTLAELRSKIDMTSNEGVSADPVEYKYTGHAIVTAVAAYNNQKVLQDETGAVLIYDPDGKLGNLEVEDEVTGIYGTLTNYWGFLEFQPTQAYEELVGIFQNVEPMEITLDQLNDQSFMNQHQSELITLKNATFNSTGSFAAYGLYEITQNGTTATAVYPYFQDANYLGSNIPSGTVNITGTNFASSKVGSTYPEWGFRYYIVPRTLNDFGTGIHDYLSENDLTIYPNPAENVLNIFLNNTKFEVTSLAIFDIEGRFVKSQIVSGNQFQINVQGLTSGNYFIRLSDGTQSYTTRFIKK